MEALEKQLKTGHPATALAKRHLLGVTLFALDRLIPALEYFHTVMERDGSNLNALANCAAVLDEFETPDEARTYQQDLTDAQRSDEVDGHMLLEQAFAHTFDTYDKSHIRSLEAPDLYARGLQLSKQLPRDDRIEWVICHGIAYYKLLKQAKGRSEYPIQEWYTAALWIFLQACQEFTDLESEFRC